MAVGVTDIAVIILILTRRVLLIFKIILKLNLLKIVKIFLLLLLTGLKLEKYLPNEPKAVMKPLVHEPLFDDLEANLDAEFNSHKGNDIQFQYIPNDLDTSYEIKLLIDMVVDLVEELELEPGVI